jgi:hypothetical protein
MPDHLHLIWMGLNLESDQINAMAFLRTHLEPKFNPLKFQHQAHDHALKSKERLHNAFARTCQYILQNPVQAELVKDPAGWPYSGSLVPGYPKLNPLHESFWPKFKKQYSRQASKATISRRSDSNCWYFRKIKAFYGQNQRQ